MVRRISDKLSRTSDVTLLPVAKQRDHRPHPSRQRREIAFLSFDRHIFSWGFFDNALKLKDEV
jgi:hypothetical protein